MLIFQYTDSDSVSLFNFILETDKLFLEEVFVTGDLRKASNHLPSFSELRNRLKPQVILDPFMKENGKQYTEADIFG